MLISIRKQYLIGILVGIMAIISTSCHAAMINDNTSKLTDDSFYTVILQK